MVTGDLQTRQRMTTSAGRDIEVRIGTGEVELTEFSRWQAAQDQRWLISNSGGLRMSDAQTELLAARDVRIDTADTIRLDWIEAGNTVSLRSARGAILDNTAAERDLIAARHLVLDAAAGIGLNWSNNLNTYITGTLVATNRVSGGINLQNWVGVSIGEGSVTNSAAGNIILIAGGTIDHRDILYQSPPGTPRSVLNPISQRIYLIHNQPYGRLLEQWGNREQGFINARISSPASEDSGPKEETWQDRIKATVTPANLLPLRSDGGGSDAATRLLQSFQQAAQTLQQSQPIRLADVLLESRDGMPRNPYGDNMLPRIQSVAAEVGGAALLQQTAGDMPAPAGAGEPVSPPMPGAAPTDNRSGGEMAWPADPLQFSLQALEQRPVLRQALQLADDSLDLPLFEDSVSAL